jgi:hypothetical protein
MDGRDDPSGSQMAGHIISGSAYEDFRRLPRGACKSAQARKCRRAQDRDGRDSDNEKTEDHSSLLT